jgi:hypothetical protein
MRCSTPFSCYDGLNLVRVQVSSAMNASKWIAGLMTGVLLNCGPLLAQDGKPPVVPPRLVKLVKPDCSKGKPCHDMHGDTTITVTVLTDGTVGDTYPKGANQVLMDAAEEAARHCRIEPGTFAGKPTSMNYDLRYKF